MKRTPLRRVSKKRAKENRRYLVLRRNYLYAHQLCEFPLCARRATQIHHKNGRSGANLNDVANWFAICAFHHDWIHSNAKRARRAGFILWK